MHVRTYIAITSVSKSKRLKIKLYFCERVIARALYTENVSSGELLWNEILGIADGTRMSDSNYFDGFHELHDYKSFPL